LRFYSTLYLGATPSFFLLVQELLEMSTDMSRLLCEDFDHRACDLVLGASSDESPLVSQLEEILTQLERATTDEAYFVVQAENCIEKG
jgi:hypothetical protein